MFHYMVKVSSVGDTLTARDTIIDRIEYYNNREHYLLFDGGDESEKRFILVSDKSMDTTMETELKDIFERTVTMEEISVNAIDRMTMKKIRTVKNLMVSSYDYDGNLRTLLVTDTADELIGKVNNMIGFTKYKEFFRNFADYIDRTIDMRAKCLYNVVLINKAEVCLDTHVELLYGLFAAKGLLLEHIMITGTVYEAESTEKATMFLYYIDDDWQTDVDGEHLKASDEVRLLNKIRRSDNIYITAMSQDQYDKLSVLSCFTAAFPNTVNIDNLTSDEKLEFIQSTSEEYGFTVNKDGFVGSRLINVMPLETIELAVRQAATRKLTANDSNNCIEISDIDIKAKKTRKISAMAELESLIGLGMVKETIKEIVTFLKKRGKDAVPCLHMCFRGNPGGGKTTVARIIARIFYEAGIIKKNLLVETDRGGLVGVYVGQTAAKTTNKIESALGGILFIDEAYSLFVGENIDYGNEAVATLVKAMEDKRDELVVILAGYTKEMDDMLSMNPGLRDRVSFYIDFPDFTESELLKIFEKLCKDNKYKLTQSAKENLLDGFSRMVAVNSQNFSNGRLVRKLFERTRIKQALRCSNNFITDTDIQAVFAEADIASMFEGINCAQIGFRA